ncbi:MAG: MBL fold metallo-hydrolase [Peredibacter sp.]|nr:MBL fold metallo-hydrolase [Peredibacter sp.]
MKLSVKAFFDAQTSTLTYIVYDVASKDAIIIDPVLNYDPNSGKISFDSLDEILRFVEMERLRPHFALETHAHADHLSSSHFLRQKFPGLKIGVGENIVKTQKFFKERFNLASLKTDGAQFDRLFRDGEEEQAGSLSFKALHTPGHTPACVSYLVGDAIFVGDTLFMPDFGTARVDFPQGSASDLYHSIHKKLFVLPDETRVFVGHDYQPGGRDLEFETTIGRQKADNIQINASVSKENYIKFRAEKDATLAAPKLLLPAIQVNIDGGKLPEPAGNGVRYLKIPLIIEDKQ